jgi:carbon monoxide dehydrogenase subunit G
MAVVKREDSWIEQAPERCSASREIAATPDRIWAELADHESWPEWFEAVKAVTVTGEGEGVGAERSVRLPGLVVDEEIIVWDVGERFAYRATGLSRGTFRSINGRVTIEDHGDGRCRVSYNQGFDPVWWFRLPFKLARRNLEKNLGAALDGLAARVE